MKQLDEVLNTIKPYVLGWIGVAGGGSGPYAPSPHDINSAHHSGSIADSQAPQFLLANGGRALTGNLAVNAGITIDGVDLSVFNSEAFVTVGNTAGLPNERALTQGDGIGISDGGAGSGITVAVNSSVARNTWPVNAGAGLTGGGNLASGGITLTVGAGAGITVNADDVALTTPGTLSVSSGNSSTGSHTHAITSSSNPGAAASLLASSAAGALQLVNLTLTGVLTTPRITAAANLTIDPAGDVVFDPTGNDILPNVNYDLNLGALSKKYLTLHAAELWVETLVAQNTIATIGGRILVGPTTTLAADLAADATAPAVSTVGTTTAVNDTAATTLTINKHASVQQGDVLVAHVAFRSDSTTVTPPAGWTEIRHDTNTGASYDIQSYLYYKVAGASEPANYAWTFPVATYAAGGIYACRSVDTGEVLEISYGQTSVSDTSCECTGGVISYDSRVLFFAASNANNQTVSPPGGMTESWDVTTTTATYYISSALATQDIAAGDIGTKTATLGTAAFSIGQMVVLTPRRRGTITVKHNQLAPFDLAYMEANGKVEFFRVVSGPTGSAGAYQYVMERNLDRTGTNDWYAGDALFNTGQAGDGFIDLYSVSGVNDGTQYGPAIVGNVRNSATYSDWTERWAIGNLNGVYGYSSDIYGMAAGKYSGSDSWLAADETNGIRILRGSTERFSLTPAGVMTIKDSGGAAVFTFNASTGAEFTKPLTLGTSGGIYQGTGTFSSPTTGLKIWNDTGVGRIAGYNASTLQWYANTDGKLYAGGGSVLLDSGGISLALGTTQYLTFKESGTVRSAFTTVKTVSTPNIYELVAASVPGTSDTAIATLLSVSGAIARSRLEAASGNTSILEVYADASGQHASYAGTGNFYLNDSANANMTQGLTINQGSTDNEILALKSSDVAHGMTTLAETDTYMSLSKVEAAYGGANLLGFLDTGATYKVAVRVAGVTSDAADTTKSTAAAAAVQLEAGVKSGTTGAAVGANGNLVIIRNYGTTRFIFDGDGDSHQDVGTAWTNFDEHDDVALLTALSVQVSRASDPIRASFGAFLEYNRERLERLKLVTFNADGHHFVNMSRLAMLLVGAVRQLDQRLTRLERAN